MSTLISRAFCPVSIIARYDSAILLSSLGAPIDVSVFYDTPMGVPTKYVRLIVSDKEKSCIGRFFLMSGNHTECKNMSLTENTEYTEERALEKQFFSFSVFSVSL